VIKASDLLIARRADTKARADFSTWRMMAKLNVASSLSTEAQGFLAEFEKLRGRTSETEAVEATIEAIYKSYYAEMGGAGAPPDSKVANPKGAAPQLAGTEAVSPAAGSKQPAPGNVISMRAKPQRPKPTAPAKNEKPRLPVALIFVCLVIITVGLRYLLQ